MIQIVIALLAGTLFGAGLTVAQMVDPQKVLGFLDIAAIRTGGWDPTLLFVFAGALPVMFLAYQVQRRMAAPLAALSFEIPSRSDIDARLIAGGAIFGIGWGLAGICPGPAITALAIGGAALPGLALFGLAMLLAISLSRHLGPSQGEPREVTA
ncbi:MAG: DUF6691 family protein [Hyphomicrobiaceae bacterium]